MLKLFRSPWQRHIAQEARALWNCTSDLHSNSHNATSSQSYIIERDIRRLHSSFSRGNPQWDKDHNMKGRKRPDLPAIIGRELLTPGAAQDVLDMMILYGNSLEDALKQPATAFLPSPLKDMQAPKKDPEGQTEDESTSAASPSTQETEIEELETDPVNSLELATKRTYQPSTIIRKRRHGFLSRLRSVGGRRVLKRRQLRGRKKMTG